MVEQNRGARHSRKQAIYRKTLRRHSNFYEHCSHWSFDRSGNAEPIHWHRERWILAAIAMLITLLSGFIMPAWASAMKPSPIAAARTVLPLSLPALPAQAPAPVIQDWHEVQVQPGQTLSDIFQSQGLDFSDLQRVLDGSDHAETLRQIHPGDVFAFRKSADGSLLGMRFDRDATHRIRLDFHDGKIDKTVVARAMQNRETIGHGVINGSLYGAAEKAGMTDATVMNLADVFKYDIDFIKDIRAGDSFTVIYDKVYRDGAFLHDGDILAAEFVSSGHRYTAYRYTLPDGNVAYYSEDGRPLRKSLLRTPVKFSRISSRFSLARRHPILGYTRAHKGVDYAAPKGTPIHAAGDGTIVFRGREHGYGNFVLIKHNSTYSTAYGHMNRFAAGEHVGTHVTQGEVIGYVGMTGLATGPHLHYEVRIHGKQENPLTMTMPKPQPLAPKLLARFHRTTVPLLARLKSVDSNIKLAQAASAADSHNG